MTILGKLAAYAAERVETAKRRISADEIKSRALALPKGNFEFESALRKPGIAFICECKKASPSKGLIAPDFPYLHIAREYESAGADAVSVLTEPRWFLGKDEYLEKIAAEISLPCLRKDFTVSDYQIFEARLLGAKAVLLICSLLSETQLREYLAVCERLGISALVETHDEMEVRSAVRAGARIIGVNHRNLNDFSVDMRNSRKLRELVPDGILFTAESGIQTVEDVAELRAIGVDAVLIGETLMRAADKKAKIQELKGKTERGTEPGVKRDGKENDQDQIMRNYPAL